MMSADALWGTMVTVSETWERIAAVRYSPKRPTRSVARGMGYSCLGFGVNSDVITGVALCAIADVPANASNNALCVNGD